MHFREVGGSGGLSSGKSSLVQCAISMNSVCLKYVNEGEIGIQYILL